MDTVSDLEGLAEVQLQVGDSPFVDVTVSDGTWHTAQWLDPDREGKTYLVTVRAMLTRIHSPDKVLLSPPTRPDTQRI